MSFEGILDGARPVIVRLRTVCNARCQGRASPVLSRWTLMPKSGSRQMPRTLSLLPPRPDVFCSSSHSDALGVASLLLMILRRVTPTRGYIPRRGQQLLAASRYLSVIQSLRYDRCAGQDSNTLFEYQRGVACFNLLD
ncbi:hypothetical protein BDZ89DRAFT_1136322 [Hymenopellis radicata]|nr:hypothetical protein BDZ89DRAFT_1136322 [Hymenopellis radicata]